MFWSLAVPQEMMDLSIQDIYGPVSMLYVGLDRLADPTAEPNVGMASEDSDLGAWEERGASRKRRVEILLMMVYNLESKAHDVGRGRGDNLLDGSRVA